MSKPFNLIFVTLMLFMQFCHVNEIDQTIKRIDDTNVDKLKGVTIHFSSKSLFNEITYMVGSRNVDCSPYGVSIKDSNPKKI